MADEKVNDEKTNPSIPLPPSEDEPGAPPPHAEIFLRYDKETDSLHFKIGEDGPVTIFPESKVDEMLAMMSLTPGGAGEKMADVFGFLVEAAKRDSDGNWVSGSNDPIAPGEFTMGGDASGGGPE